MAANRADAAAAGLVLRPVVFPPAAQVAAESPAPAGDDAQASSLLETEQSPAALSDYTPASTRFLQTKGRREGVLCVHRATWIKV